MDRSVDLTAHASSPAQTADIASVLGDLAQPGDVLVLGGDLGAGKTTFTKSFGAGLGVSEPITSPTFTLAQRYDTGRLLLHHLDVYRLDQIDEAIDLALPELLESGGVVVIEWGDKILPALPPDFLHIGFSFGEGDDDRRLDFVAIGPRWQGRVTSIAEALTGHVLETKGGDVEC